MRRGRTLCRWKSLSRGRRRVSQGPKMRSTVTNASSAWDFLSMSAIPSSSTHPLNWESVLNGHPIFDPSVDDSSDKNSQKVDETSLELSISSLSKSKPSDIIQDEGIPNGRRRTMLIKDADLIVAVGKQVRMTSLTESRLTPAGERTFKVKRVEMNQINTRLSFMHTILDVMHAKPAIRNPRTCIKPEWAPSRGSGCIPSCSNRATTSRVHKTRATNSRLQVRPLPEAHVALIHEGWVDLCKSVSSTTLLVPRHESPRSIGTHGVRVVPPSW